jgi:hypothetical protein
MILILKNKVSICLVLSVFLLLPVFVSAQNSLTLSVTPPLFQLSAVREQVWQSNVKVINSNSFPITVYANPVNFAPIGEEGRGQFIPVFETDTKGQTLAEWITVSTEAINIPAESSAEVTFTVSVPKEASPGGHFAAILIGTRPPENDGTTAVRTAQVVSSLFFLSIDGDVQEKASIREFSVTDNFVDSPQVDFLLRLQNDGNVHIRPQGEIKIYNMWGKERGVIPINHGSHFGNVLPDTIRKFDFSWKGESSLTEIGRYKAVVSLGFGTKAHQTISQEVSFWIVPVKLTLLAFLFVIILIVLIRWAIKSYVRRMLIMAGIDPQEREAARMSGAVVMTKRFTLKKEKSKKENLQEPEDTNWLIELISRYRYFFVGIPSAMILLGCIFWYLSGALVAERNFEATIGQGESEVKINSEELKLQEKSDVNNVESSKIIIEENESQDFILNVVNVSGEPGIAAEIAVQLESAGYTLHSLEPDLERTQDTTVVVTNESSALAAQEISKLLGNVLVSFKEEESSENVSEITVFVGKDAQK